MTSRSTRCAAVVVDLGFGDAGKGAVTDYLVRQLSAHSVVRFNGGAQAGHNVVAPDGRHHTFSQFGAGTFVPDVMTILSRHVAVHPTALLVEAARLATIGVSDPLGRLLVSENALVVTPFHQAAGRLRELGRGRARHGSCGVGVGEAVSDARHGKDDVASMRDLREPIALRRRLQRIQERKRAELASEIERCAELPRASSERFVLEDPRIVDAWLESVAPFAARGVIVDETLISARLRMPGAVVFEGAQGVLLDEWRGFHPYTTFSNCTPENALSLLREHGHDGSIVRVGVMRTFAVRHGPGPFPTEQPELGEKLADPNNVAGPWQGALRIGWLDFVLARYAHSVTGGIDVLAMTHLDALARLPLWRVCRGYRVRGAVDARLFEAAPGDASRIDRVRLGSRGDLDHQSSLTHALADVIPLYDDVALGEGWEPVQRYLALVEAELGVCVVIRGSGASSLEVRV